MLRTCTIAVVTFALTGTAIAQSPYYAGPLADLQRGYHRAPPRYAADVSIRPGYLDRSAQEEIHRVAAMQYARMAADEVPYLRTGMSRYHEAQVPAFDPRGASGYDVRKFGWDSAPPVAACDTPAHYPRPRYDEYRPSNRDPNTNRILSDRDKYVKNNVFGDDTIYDRGQPVRNIFRFLFP